jgi:hypothetical protein
MIITKKKTVKQEISYKIICNKCGEEHLLDEEFFPDFIKIDHTYDYGSKEDQQRFISHICENCMDEFYKTFKIPPTVL